MLHCGCRFWGAQQWVQWPMRLKFLHAHLWGCWGAPCHPSGKLHCSLQQDGRAACIPARLFISFTIQYSPAALSLLYIYQYYQLIPQSHSVGLLILPSDLWEAAALYIPAPSPAPPSPHAMFN